MMIKIRLFKPEKTAKLQVQRSNLSDYY